MTIETGKGRKKSRGRLRIVAGIWRSRVLEIADVEGLRPTSERIRETLFNWLTPSLAGARCLDLFAGTGALGLEALSRGAASTVFVENSKTAIATLRRNVASLDTSAASVHTGTATDFIDGSGTESFDIVFLDPPFGVIDLEYLCTLLDSNWLARGAHIYIETRCDAEVPKFPAGWTTVRDKTAGQVRFRLVQIGRAPCRERV